METEKFVSGYCRCLDQSRMVAAVYANGVLTEADCGFPDCPYAPNCSIAEKLREELN